MPEYNYIILFELIQFATDGKVGRHTTRKSIKTMPLLTLYLLRERMNLSSLL